MVKLKLHILATLREGLELESLQKTLTFGKIEGVGGEGILHRGADVGVRDVLMASQRLIDTSFLSVLGVEDGHGYLAGCYSWSQRARHN